MTRRPRRLHAGMLAVAGLVVCIPPEVPLAKSRSATSALVTSALDLKSLATENGRSALVSATAEYCRDLDNAFPRNSPRSEEHTSELQSLMRISYAVSCLKKKKQKLNITHNHIPSKYQILLKANLQ